MAGRRVRDGGASGRVSGAVAVAGAGAGACG